MFWSVPPFFVHESRISLSTILCGPSHLQAPVSNSKQKRQWSALTQCRWSCPSYMLLPHCVWATKCIETTNCILNLLVPHGWFPIMKEKLRSTYAWQKFRKLLLKTKCLVHTSHGLKEQTAPHQICLAWLELIFGIKCMRDGTDRWRRGGGAAERWRRGGRDVAEMWQENSWHTGSFSFSSIRKIFLSWVSLVNKYTVYQRLSTPKQILKGVDPSWALLLAVVNVFVWEGLSASPSFVSAILIACIFNSKVFPQPHLP